MRISKIVLGAFCAGLMVSSVSDALDGTEEVVEKVYSKKERKAIKKLDVEAELLSNLQAIQTAQAAYESNFDIFVSANQYPTSPSSKGVKWVNKDAGGFADLGWAPDGKIRGAYSVTTTSIDFTAIGIGDIDGDGTMETYRATKSVNAQSKID